MVKIELGKPRKDQTRKLYILSDTRGQKKRHALPIWLTESEWDAKRNRVKEKNPNHVRYNKLIREKIAAAEDGIPEVVDNTVAGLLRSRANHFAAESRGSSALAYDNAAAVAEKFLPIPISRLTTYAIKTFADKLKADGYAHNTVTLHLSKIKTVCKIHGLKPCPFDGVQLKMQPTTKPKLNIDGVAFLETLDLPLKSKDDLARDFVLLLLYFGGSRAGDVLKRTHADIFDDVDREGNDVKRIHYFSSKGNKYIKRKLSDKALAIIEKWKGGKHIFPIADTVVETGDTREDYKQWRKLVAHIDGGLQNIHRRTGMPIKSLSTHVARHTAAEWVRKTTNDPYLAQRMLAHSDIKTTASTYFNDDQTEIDAATEHLSSVGG